MHLPPNPGASETIQPVGIKVLILTDEAESAQIMLGALELCQYDLLVCGLRDLSTLAADVEAELAAVRGKMPVLVMIDFKFVGEACEAVLDRIEALKGDMAIECLVTGAPESGALTDRLRKRGVFLFDEGAELAGSILEFH